MGVDIFFVISGFLITGLFIDDLNGNIHIKRFYARRAFKIIPSYFLVIIVSLILSIIVAPKFLRGPLTVLSHFLFFQNYLPRIPILGHTWAIAIEAHFYLIYPLLLQAICLMVKTPRARKIFLFFILAALTILGNVLRYHYFHLPGASSYPALWQMTQFRLDALFFGGLIKLGEPFFLKTSRPRSTLYALFYFSLAIVLFAYLVRHFNYFTWYHYAIAYFASGALIISGLQGRTVLNSVLENTWLAWVGQNSYGIYLWHLIALYPFKKLLSPLGLPLTLLIPCYIATSLFAGAISTMTLEKYFLRLRKHIMP